MTKRFDVLVIGELNIDIILNHINGHPEIGKEKVARKMDTVLGSSAAIFASNLSRLGKEVGFIGKIGNDNYSSIVINSLERSGVNTSSIIQSDVYATGVTIVLNYGEDRAMVTFPGAMDHFTANEINPELLAQARHLHFSSYFLQPGLRDNLGSIFKTAKKLGLSTSLDPQWDPQEEWKFDCEGILPYVDVFMPNLTEFLKISSTKNVEHGISKIREFANCIVIKAGKKGAIGWTRDRLTKADAFINENVVDAIGAGDSFNAGFIAKFIEGCPVESCLLFGNLTGAISTTAAGGTGAFRDYKSMMQVAVEKFNYTEE